jgi:hypothetical protein
MRWRRSPPPPPPLRRPPLRLSTRISGPQEYCLPQCHCTSTTHMIKGKVSGSVKSIRSKKKRREKVASSTPTHRHSCKPRGNTNHASVQRNQIKALNTVWSSKSLKRSAASFIRSHNPIHLFLQETPPPVHPHMGRQQCDLHKAETELQTDTIAETETSSSISTPPDAIHCHAIHCQD